MSLRVILLELNEVNFDYVFGYAERGKLPHLKKLIDTHGVTHTSSEQSFDNVEPWIQWVTAHTGLDYEDHAIYRLGDIVTRDIPQIWERLEEHGFRVGAMSPMNAKNRTRNAAFFLPDPWTPTPLTAAPLAKRMHAAIAQVVNDNATARIAPASLAWLLAGLARYARVPNYGLYTTLVARRKPWCKAMFLDLLLADTFVREAQRTAPHFASLFLNGAAHVQHHYLFNSPLYRGDQKNPGWYVSTAEDPLGEIYSLYDRVVGQVQSAFPDARLMVATGLHQDPHKKITVYWRLKQHEAFLRKIGVPFARVETRMSRDFIVRCASNEQAATAERLLKGARAADGTSLFEVDNQGRDLFAMLTWPKDIDANFEYTVGEARFKGLRDDVAFVAIKNGEHNHVGYFIDTGATPATIPRTFPLRELPARICAALGVEWKPDVQRAA